MSTAKKELPCNPEIWGGIECTIARIDDGYRDQLALAGHYERPSDIAAFAALGIKALRYPVLWEVHQPSQSSSIDWSRSDKALAAIREEGMVPIAGLLHHGSGPSFTSLLDPDFPDLFAAYAGAVAGRYPWIDYYTPINEPLTTARFSGLYGHWYPHARDDSSFARMLIHQVIGIIKAMEAIRAVNPSAQLLQTEDLAKIHHSPSLAYQAAFENQRCWLTYDLLCGRVDRTHVLYEYLLSSGIREAELEFCLEHRCAPDLLGVNYYVTSERFLDEGLEKYPRMTHGSNGRHFYADVAAVRVGRAVGIGPLLTEAYARYGIPIVISEVHMNCTREEQLRWLYEVWGAACRVVRSGVDIRAVTSWALIGAYDWDSLLVYPHGHYECGAYCIADGAVRLTAVGCLLKMLAGGSRIVHPLLETAGWWSPDRSLPTGCKRLLIVGQEGPCVSVFRDLCNMRGILLRVIDPMHAVVDPGTAGIWGAIEIGMGGYPMTGLYPMTVREYCERRGLPYMLIEAVDSVEVMQRHLDDLIDRSFEIATIFPSSIKPELSYGEEQVHVCDRHRE